MNRLEGQYTPTIFQSAIGDPLRSEQRTGEFLPRVLSRVDMLILLIAIILSFPTPAVDPIIQGSGNATYLYRIIAAATFLVPGAIVTGQLNRFMPVDGSIYVWSHRALGPLWGFFAGFCAWFPGVLGLLILSETILSLIQDIGVRIAGPHANWLTEAWQQGLITLAILVLVGWISTFPLHVVMKLVKGAILLYLLGYLSIGLAGIVWLLSGHTPQTSNTTSQLGPGIQNIIAPYALGVLALLGVEVPLNMAAETKQHNAAAFALRWGPLLVLAASLLATLGFLVVVPAPSSASYVEPVRIVFGIPAAVLLDIILVGSTVFICVAFNMTFARILFVSALDHRLPAVLAKVNRHAAPSHATTVQVITVAIIVIITYFIGPLLYPHLSYIIYHVTAATIEVIWCLSMTILFLDLLILLRRFRSLFAKHPDQLIAPPWVLYLCCAMGSVASLVGIVAPLSASFDSKLIPDNQWGGIVGGVVLASLAIGLIGSAYPRLLSSLNEQTAAARENARLYNELSIAYAKLSELDQLKDAFLATASHELRTPLTIMQGYLELLGEIEDLSPEVQRSFLNNARRACDELVLLQANIMDASRLEIDAATLRCATIPLKDICMGVVDLFEPLTLQEQRQIEVDIAADITVWVDETRLKQILRNLIANALRYSPPQTPLRITAELEQAQDMVRIHVIDRGPGIPPDKQEAIFDKFVRLERDMHGPVGGTGLGLFITRQLVEAMGGTITVESSGVDGEGSIFSFTLPLKDRTI